MSVFEFVCTPLLFNVLYVCVCVCVVLPSAAEGEFYDPPDRETMRLQKFGKLLAGPNTDLGTVEHKVHTVVFSQLCTKVLYKAYAEYLSS